MLREILEAFIGKASEGGKKFSAKEKSFLSTLVRLSDEEKTFILSTDSEEQDVFNKIVEMGFEDAITEIAEDVLEIKFIDISKIDRNPSIDNLAKSSTLAALGVFSTIVGDRVTFVISNKDQLDAIKQNSNIDDYDVFICWPWKIYEKNKESALVTIDVSGKNQHVIMATGQRQIDSVVRYFNGYIVDSIVKYRKDLVDECKKYSPDILVVSDNIGGKEELIDILIQIKSNNRNIRIIYFTTEIGPREDVRKSLISVLIKLGVYDIMFDNKFSVDVLRYILGNPKPKSSVEKLILKNSLTRVGKGGITIIGTEDGVDSGTLLHAKANVYSFISSKGGTGKTFIIGNIARAIAKYGISKNGNKVKVALIDGDFFGGGLTNQLKLDEKKVKEDNIITAIKRASNIIKDGKVVADDPTRELAIEKIKNSFIPVVDCPNIKVLPACPQQLTDKEFKEIQGEYIQFIAETVVDDYDIVLVDITGDFELNVWFPVFTLSRYVFSVINMEFNSISNAIKQEAIIEDFVHNKKKVQYVFNKVINDDSVLWGMDKIREQNIFDIIGEILYVNKIKMINNNFEGKWIIDEDTEELEMANLSILRFANKIWPIKDINKKERDIKTKLEPQREDFEKPKSFKDLISVGIKELFPWSEDAEKKLRQKKGGD